MDGVTPDRVMQVAGGAWAAAAVACGLELGVFAELGRGPRSAEQVSRRLGLTVATCTNFLDALVGLQLIERDGQGRRALYLNTREAAVFLDPRSPDCIGALLREVPQADQLGRRLRGAAEAPEADDAAQRACSRLTGHALAAPLDLAGVRQALVLGGHADALACGLALASRGLQVGAVVPARHRPRAMAAIAAADLVARVTCLPPSAPWPAAELVLCQDLRMRRHAAALQRARRALAPEGRLVLVLPLVDDERRRSPQALLRAVTAGPRSAAPWTEAALRQACLRAGLRPVAVHALAGGQSAFVAAG